jgi:zinc protease
MLKYITIAATAALFTQTAAAQIKIDRSKKPSAGPAPIIKLQDPVTYVLPNGMTVLIVENHKIGKVSASLSIDAGPILEGNKAGTVDLLGGMLNEGTTNMPKEKFDEAVDAIGADVSLGAAGGSATALTRYFEKAFMLMADAVKNPAFPQASFDKLQKQTITGLKSNERSTPAIANRVVDALNFGKNTALGEFVTEETVKNIKLDDVKAAYKNYVTPSRSYLTFVGDITPTVAKALVAKAFGSWTGKKLELPAITPAANPTKSEIDFVDVPTAVQGELSISNLVNNPMNGKDYHALILANQILGGGAESKLFMALREKRGFTYGSYSNMGSSRYQSLFKASAAVRTDKVDSAVQEMVAQVLSMRDGKITAEELASAKAIYNGTFALRMEDPGTAARYASNILINNLPKDYYKTFLQKVNAVTPADIKRVANDYMKTDNARIVIAGNAKKIIPNLLRLGYPIKKFDKFANPIADEQPEVKVNTTAASSDAVSANSVMESYYKAVGGRAEMEKVKSLSSKVNTEIMGMNLTGSNKQKLPFSTLAELTYGERVVYRKAFNGLTGSMKQGPMEPAPFGEEEAKEAKDELSIFPQLGYNSKEYIGKGKVGDEETYRIKVTLPSGAVAVQQYSIKTGLLLQEEKTTKKDGADVVSTTDLKDYKKVGNLMLPHNIVTSAEGQEFNVRLSDYVVNPVIADEEFK